MARTDIILKVRAFKQSWNRFRSRPGLLQTFTNYITILGTLISLFFALWAIKLSIQQAEDRSQLNKLGEIAENQLATNKNQLATNKVLMDLLIDTKKENEKILDLISESKNQSSTLKRQFRLALTAQYYTLHSEHTKMMIDEYKYQQSQLGLTHIYNSVVDDSAKWNTDMKFLVMKNIDSIARSQETNPIILNELLGIHWKNLAISDMISTISKFDSDKTAYNKQAKEWHIKISFPPIISRLKLVFDDAQKPFIYQRRLFLESFMKELERKNSFSGN